jgi:hypothetical protein
MPATTTTIPAVAFPPTVETRPLAVRRHETWSPGDCAHQGDLIFVCLVSLPTGAKPRENRQLVDGDTRGSRHVLEGGSCCDCDTVMVASAVKAATGGAIDVEARYVGPVFTGGDDGATVTHPEHQHQWFPAGSVTACLYQRNVDADERANPARD